MWGGVGYLVAGLVFAVGLTLSGMTQPSKVKGFLDVTGRWDPSLAFVMLGAVAVYFVAHRLVLRRARPLFAAALPPPPPARIDVALVGGAALFGVGWGLSGLCPGPALVTAGAAIVPSLWFVAAMLGGMALHQLVAKR